MLFEVRPTAVVLVNSREAATVVPSNAGTFKLSGEETGARRHVGGCGAVRECWHKGATLLPAKGYRVRGGGQAYVIVALLVVAAMQTVGAEPVRARDKVSLPFTCSVDNGRLRVEPSAERSYPIVGPRDQQAFTYCPATDNGRCRTWTVHRFVVQCSGGRAMWPEIVAAAGRDHNRTSFENGQLLLRLGPRRNDTGDATCGDPAEAPNGPAARWPRCQLAGYSPPRNAQRTHTLALPRGYAPLGLINARVLVENETAPSSPQPAPSSTSSTSASPSTRAQTPLRGPDTEVAFQPAPLAPAVVPKQLAREVVNEALEAPQMPLVAETSLAPVPLPEVELRPEQPLPAIPIGWTPWIEMAAAIVPREEPAAPPPADPMIRLFAMMLAATELWPRPVPFFESTSRRCRGGGSSGRARPAMSTGLAPSYSEPRPRGI